MSAKPVYPRILLKLSGEALLGDLPFGIDADVTTFIAGEVKAAIEAGVQVALVVGGGNIFRGEGLARAGMDRVTGDRMGMLATVINALALQDAIERAGVEVRVMSALKINQVCEDYIRRRAIRHLEKGRVVIFASGTGNPFFTTDSAAALRSVEVGADLLLKATLVDGVYTADPKKDPTATRYRTLTYDEALNRRLGVMDQTALVMARDHRMTLCVYEMARPGALMQILSGDENTGTYVRV